jgi:hypothetical protein
MDLREAVEQRDSIQEKLSAVDRDLRHYVAIMRRGGVRVDADLSGVELDGRPISVKLQDLDKALLIYTIDPNCDECRAGIPFIKSMAQESICGAQVLGLAIGDLGLIDKFRAEYDIKFQILRHASGSAWKTLPLLSVSPTTVLVGPGTQFPQWWLGGLSSERRTEIVHALKQRC